MSIALASTILVALGPPPVGMSRDAVQEDRDTVRLRTVQFGNCVVKREPDLALAYVMRPPEVFTVPAGSKGTYTVAEALKEIEARKNRAPDKMLGRLMISKCVFRKFESSSEVAIRFPGDALRYALSDGLFSRNYRSRPPLSNLDAVPVREQSGALNSFGECIVRSNPGGAHALLSAEVLKPAEVAAFDALKPTMGSCLGSNSTVKLSKLLIRGAVAYNYVLLANAPASAKAIN